jgi:nitroreductase
MGFLDLAKKRYSVRSYQTKKVEKDKLNLILEAGRIAPTAANRQPQRILVIESEEGLLKLQKAAKGFGAPCALIVCSESTKVWVRPQDGMKTIDIDASIITDHMMLQATDLGLGSLWMTWFDPKILREEFEIPENLIPVNLLLIGYAADAGSDPERHDKTRKPISETVFFEKF